MHYEWNIITDLQSTTNSHGIVILHKKNIPISLQASDDIKLFKEFITVVIIPQSFLGMDDIILAFLIHTTYPPKNITEKKDK